MTNKYYYNGKLVRTSKTMEYNFGVRHGDAIIACSSTRQGAENLLNGEQRLVIKNLQFNIDIQNGKARPPKGSEEYYTPEQVISNILSYKAWLNPKDWEIVNLEKQA